MKKPPVPTEQEMAGTTAGQDAEAKTKSLPLLSIKPWSSQL
jgi:hypothetical protein